MAGDTTNRRIYYTMGEVSEMFDVNPSLIRFWEKKFDIIKPHKNKKGNRLFTPEDVENLKLIYRLVKENGMTLAGAQKRIKENRLGIARDMEILESLYAVRATLLEIRQELKVGSDAFSDAEEDILAAPHPTAQRAAEPAREVEAPVDAMPEHSEFANRETEEITAYPEADVRAEEPYAENGEESDAPVMAAAEFMAPEHSSPIAPEAPELSLPDEEEYAYEEPEGMQGFTQEAEESAPPFEVQPLWEDNASAPADATGEDDLDAEYIAAMKDELAAAAEIAQAIAEMDGKGGREDDKPRIVEQTLF